MPTTGTVRLCIGILTLNEEKRIAACIRSAAWADQIVVVDSGSHDRTVEIAQSLGAEVHLYPDWKGFAEQRNRLLRHNRGDYIFFLDADEEITPELALEIRQVLESGHTAIWEVQWIQVAYGRPLTRMRSTGGVQRMFRSASVLRFDGVVHENAVTQPTGLPVRHFRGKLMHYSRETIYGSLQKLAQYSQLGAAKRARSGKTGGVLRGLASAAANFFRLYVLGRGFLCGAEGFLYCLFVALESFFRYAILRYDRDSLDGFAKR
jgi:glycosyltransferase involved in cell wall biosynthesis